MINKWTKNGEPSLYDNREIDLITKSQHFKMVARKTMFSLQEFSLGRDKKRLKEKAREITKGHLYKRSDWDLTYVNRAWHI
jgi:hypothetical protein